MIAQKRVRVSGDLEDEGEVRFQSGDIYGFAPGDPTVLDPSNIPAEIVERAAKALWSAWIGGDDRPLERARLHVQEHWRVLARAALEAALTVEGETA